MTASLGDLPQKVKDNTSNSEDDYDPHEHRNVKNPTNNWQTYAHFLKASIGTGVLAMPSAFANAGYINGIILTAIIGFLAVYCLHILIGSMYELCKRKRVPYLTFSEAMTMGFQQGPPCFKCIVPIATPFVDGFLAFYHFGICCVYVVFISESIKQIVDEYLVVLDLRIHMCFVLVPLFLIYSIRNLRFLALFSSFANILLFVGFGVILYYIFDDLPPLSERKPVEDIAKMPIFFGTVLFALEAVGVILAIEENMKTPKAYLKPFGIMNIGMTIVLSLYVILGFFGYWKYGDASKGSVTLNIPQEEILCCRFSSRIITISLFGWLILSINIGYHISSIITNLCTISYWLWANENTFNQKYFTCDIWYLRWCNWNVR
ncbi:arcus isoform 2-T2 [Cochliomyia hominivorax]